MHRFSALALAFLACAATTSNVPVLAQGSTPAGPMSVTQQATEDARRVGEYRELFKSPDLRASALQMAAKDPNPVVRGMALTEALLPFKTLSPEFVFPPSGTIPIGDVPALVIALIKWADDGKSFTGISTGNSCGQFSVSGQVSGGKVTLTYSSLCLKADWSTTKLPGNTFVTSCQVIMALTAEGNYLQGPFRCIGISKALDVRLPFGA